MSETVVQKGIKINFVDKNNLSENKSSSFDFSTYTTGFETVVQNALIDTMTDVGSDKVYPERGTNIQNNAWRAILNKDNIIHILNFAALDVSSFINQEIINGLSDEDKNKLNSTSVVSNDYFRNLKEELILNYNLNVLKFTEKGIVLNAYFKSIKDSSIGNEVTITTLLSN